MQGTYVIKFTYSTKNTAPKYKSFTITTTLAVKDPVHTWEYNRLYGRIRNKDI